MEAVISSETSLYFYRTALRHIPENSILHSLCYENINSNRTCNITEPASCTVSSDMEDLCRPRDPPRIGAAPFTWRWEKNWPQKRHISCHLDNRTVNNANGILKQCNKSLVICVSILTIIEIGGSLEISTIGWDTNLFYGLLNPWSIRELPSAV
jgi:hypothetical protein